MENTKKGFFEAELNDLETIVDVREELAKYVAADLCELNEEGFLKIRIPQFRGINAHVTKSLSKKTGMLFYSCDLYINNPLKHHLEIFDEGVYQDILLRNDFISTEYKEFDIPVRVRFIKGYSEKALSEDHIYYGLEVIFPGLKRIFREFLKPSEVDRINYLSLKSTEECEKQKIQAWNDAYRLFRVDDDKLVGNLWDLEQPGSED